MNNMYCLDASPKEDSWRISQADIVLKDTGLPFLTDAVKFILKRHLRDDACHSAPRVMMELQKKLSHGTIETNIHEILSFVRERNGKIQTDDDRFNKLARMH